MYQPTAEGYRKKRQWWYWKSEPLKYQEGWSKRIDDSNRLVYDIKDDLIEVIQCKGHYDGQGFHGVLIEAILDDLGHWS